MKVCQEGMPPNLRQRNSLVVNTIYPILPQLLQLPQLPQSPHYHIIYPIHPNFFIKLSFTSITSFTQFSPNFTLIEFYPNLYLIASFTLIYPSTAKSYTGLVICIWCSANYTFTYSAKPHAKWCIAFWEFKRIYRAKQSYCAPSDTIHIGNAGVFFEIS